MIKVTADSEGPLKFTASVEGVPIYLDNFAIIRFATSERKLGERLVSAVKAGGELLFSVSNATEIAGPTGSSATAVQCFLDEFGPNWFPVEMNAFKVVERELKGTTYGLASLSQDFFKSYFNALITPYEPGSGRVIDLSESFFKLGGILDWLRSQRESVAQGAREMDEALIKKIAEHRSSFERNPQWLDETFPLLPFNPEKPATFVYVNLVRSLILEAKAYKLKKGDGIDFCHAVVGTAFAKFAAVDKHWKRRISLLPKPNEVARVFYVRELEGMVSQLERAVADLSIQRELSAASGRS